ncbi:MAG: glycosyltransferase [Rhizobiales bacterium]|nr:glycosyltransferase [Hyphomicrobiales bacterium]
MSETAEPVVSVITCVRNGAQFVEDTIVSVLAQRDVTLDYQIIDGASTDGTVDIVRRYADRLSGWISEPDRGIADAFNKGIDRARGDYLMFLNSDDALAHPRALADLLEFAHSKNWPDVVYGDCDLYDRGTGALLYRTIIDYDRARFLRAETVPHPSMLMHRRYFETYGRFDLSFEVAMDYELFVRGIPSVGAAHADLLTTNVRAGGISARSRGLAVREIVRALQKHGHLGPMAELRMRAMFFARGMARRGLENLGLYAAFDSLRRRQKTVSGAQS